MQAAKAAEAEREEEEGDYYLCLAKPLWEASELVCCFDLAARYAPLHSLPTVLQCITDESETEVEISEHEFERLSPQRRRDIRTKVVDPENHVREFFLQLRISLNSSDLEGLQGDRVEVLKEWDPSLSDGDAGPSSTSRITEENSPSAVGNRGEEEEGDSSDDDQRYGDTLLGSVCDRIGDQPAVFFPRSWALSIAKKFGIAKHEAMPRIASQVRDSVHVNLPGGVCIPHPCFNLIISYRSGGEDAFIDGKVSVHRRMAYKSIVSALSLDRFPQEPAPPMYEKRINGLYCRNADRTWWNIANGQTPVRLKDVKKKLLGEGDNRLSSPLFVCMVAPEPEIEEGVGSSSGVPPPSSTQNFDTGQPSNTSTSTSSSTTSSGHSRPSSSSLGGVQDMDTSSSSSSSHSSASTSTTSSSTTTSNAPPPLSHATTSAPQSAHRVMTSDMDIARPLHPSNSGSSDPINLANSVPMHTMASSAASGPLPAPPIPPPPSHPVPEATVPSPVDPNDVDSMDLGDGDGDIDPIDPINHANSVPMHTMASSAASGPLPAPPIPPPPSHPVPEATALRPVDLNDIHSIDLGDDDGDDLSDLGSFDRDPNVPSAGLLPGGEPSLFDTNIWDH